MSYSYHDHDAWLGSEEGIDAVGEVIRKVATVLDPAGCARMSSLWPSGVSSSDKMMAAVDRVAHMQVIAEVALAQRPRGQDRIFVRPRP